MVGGGVVPLNVVLSGKHVGPNDLARGQAATDFTVSVA